MDDIQMFISFTADIMYLCIVECDFDKELKIAGLQMYFVF